VDVRRRDEGVHRRGLAVAHGLGGAHEGRVLLAANPVGRVLVHRDHLAGDDQVEVAVAVHVAQHPTLKREGTELIYEADVSIAQAALGATIAVPTVDGEEEVEVKAGTQPGTEIRLRGRGVPHLRRGSKGDLHVFVNVVVPSKLSKRQRELLAEYAAESGEAVADGGSGILGKVRDALG